MDIDRYAPPVAVYKAGAADCLRADNLLPLAFSCYVGQVEKFALRNQLLVLAAGVELRCSGRVTAEHALHDRGAGGLAKCNGAIDPFVA